MKVYPPNATLLSSKVSPLKPLMQEGQGGLSNVITPTQPTTNDTGIEVGEPDTVGEWKLMFASIHLTVVPTPAR